MDIPTALAAVAASAPASVRQWIAGTCSSSPVMDGFRHAEDAYTWGPVLHIEVDACYKGTAMDLSSTL